MSNFLVHTYHNPPEKTAGSERVSSLVDHLANHEGEEIAVVTLDYCKSNGDLEPRNDNVRVVRLDPMEYSKESFVKRAMGEFLILLKIVLNARKLSAEKVLISIPSMFLMLLAPMFLNGKTLTLDVRDLVWDYLPENSFVLHFCKYILWILVRHSLKNYDLVLVTNSIQAEKLELICPKVRGRLKVVENGISRVRFDGLDKTREIIQQRSESVRRPYRISSVGNVGMSLHIETLIHAAAELQSDDFEFYIVGDGTQLNKAKKLVRNKGLTNIQFMEQLDWNKLGEYYSQSDLLYLQVHPDYNSSRPVRLYEYLATGLPIVLADRGEARNFALQFDNIFNIESCCETQLRDLLIQLKNDPPIRFYAENVQKIADEFVREDQLKREFRDAIQITIVDPLTKGKKGNILVRAIKFRSTNQYYFYLNELSRPSL